MYKEVSRDIHHSMCLSVTCREQRATSELIHSARVICCVALHSSLIILFCNVTLIIQLCKVCNKWTHVV